MRTRIGKLKATDNLLIQEMTLRAQQMELKNRKREQAVRTLKGRMEFIKRLKTQQKKWNQLWKTLAKQQQNPENKAHKRSIENAMRICNENFRLTDARINRQKQQIKKELRKD